MSILTLLAETEFFNKRDGDVNNNCFQTKVNCFDCSYDFVCNDTTLRVTSGIVTAVFLFNSSSSPFLRPCDQASTSETWISYSGIYYSIAQYQ